MSDTQLFEPQIIVHFAAIRAALGLKLREVQALTRNRVTRSWLQRAEVGECAITVPRLLWLAHTYEKSPHELVEYPDWPVPQPCTCPCHSQRER